MWSGGEKHEIGVINSVNNKWTNENEKLKSEYKTNKYELAKWNNQYARSKPNITG